VTLFFLFLFFFGNSACLYDAALFLFSHYTFVYQCVTLSEII